MDEQAIKEFWQGILGEAQVEALRRRFGGYHQSFGTDFSQFLDWNEAAHARRAASVALDQADKKVLEIGLGEGAESERLIRQGARWSGVDLTAEAVERVRTRLTLRELPYEELRPGSVLDLPFADDSFDVVFSHGVLHHVPEIKQAQSEIHRVLHPGGELVIMVYARWSLNYLMSIGVIRRQPPCSRLTRSPGPGSSATIPLRGNAGRSSRQRQGPGTGPLPPPGGLRPPQHRRTRQPVTPWCMTVGASSATSRPSGSPASTSASCTRRPCRYTGCRARPSWDGICGLIWNR